MKDYISEKRALIGSDDIAQLAIQTSENTAAIAKITDEMLRKSDLPKYSRILCHQTLEKSY